MAHLAEVVRELAGRDGVEAVVLVSRDGLPIDHAARGDCDADAMAALATTLLRPAARLGETARRGSLARAVFEFAGGFGILTVLPDQNALLVLLSPDADAGVMLYDLGRLAPALSSLL
jgi:predicted regulator of Ras-like GTPase activity (Roadblock/LC7/MglB family)